MVELVVDDRWRGHHGIARYSTEVLSRLSTTWRSLGFRSRPGSVLDLLTPRAFVGASTIYSPGYNVGFSSTTTQLCTVHDLIHLEHGGPQHRLYYDRVLRPVIKRAGAVLTVSETSRAAIVDWVGDDTVSVVNTGNGCSSAFNLEVPVPAVGRPYFLYVGNLKSHKNFDVVLTAVSQIADVDLVAVTPSIEELQRRCDDLGVPRDRVKAYASLSDEQLAPLYRGAVSTLVPSLLEGFGLPALESIACGTPVVHWSGCASVAEIVEGNGRSVERATDADEWITAMRTELDRPTAVAADATSRFAWDSVAHRVDEALTAKGREQS